MTGTFEYGRGDKRALPDFNVFFRYHANYPFYSDAIWYLTQMRRWGQIPEGKPDAWYVETAKKVYRPDVYLRGRASCWSPRRRRSRRTFRLRQRRVPRADQGIHRRHRVRRPQAECLHREARDRPEGPAEDRERQCRRQVTCNRVDSCRLPERRRRGARRSRRAPPPASRASRA